jgi:hypothetical protein
MMIRYHQRLRPPTRRREREDFRRAGPVRSMYVSWCVVCWRRCVGYVDALSDEYEARFSHGLRSSMNACNVQFPFLRACCVLL